MNMRRSRGIAHAISGGLDGFVFVIAKLVSEQADAVFETGASRLSAAGKLARFGKDRAFVRSLMILEIIFALVIGLPNIKHRIGQRLLGGMTPNPAAHHEQFPRRHRGCHLASERRAAGPERPEDVRVRGLKFSLRRDFLTGGLQIMDVAMGILRDRRGCGMRMQGERAAGGG